MVNGVWKMLRSLVDVKVVLGWSDERGAEVEGEVG
jgi:hypothetical protein